MKGTIVHDLLGALAAVAMLATTSACTVTTSAEPEAVYVPPPPVTAAKAMAIEGVWATTCNLEQGAYMKQTIVFRDNAMNLHVEGFQNPACAGQPFFKADVAGTMAYVGKSLYVNSANDVELTLTQPDGKVEVQKTVILLEKSMLYTSDKSKTTPGQWPNQIDRNRPYFYVGG